MSSNRQPRRFFASTRRHVRLLAWLIGAFLVLSFVLNTLVDPLRMNRMPWAIGALDPYRKISSEIRTGKAGILLSHPEARIAFVGSSRVAHAFDPLNAGWSRLAVNLGLPGGFIHESLAMANYAARNARLEMVIIGIDPGDLSASYDSRPGGDFYSSPLADMGMQDRLNLSLRHLFGISAFESSLKTLADAFTDQPMRYSPLGLRLRRAKDDGQDQLAFIRKGLVQPESTILPPADSVFTLNEGKQAMLKKTVSSLRQQGIRVVLIYLPRHALNYASGTARDFQPEAPFAHERRALTVLAAAENIHAPELPAVEAWDFNGFREIDCERLPTTPKNRMTYWNDLDHYTLQVGNLILSRVMGWPAPEGLDVAYGDRLLPETIESHLVSIKARHLRYVREIGIDDIALKRSIAPKR